MEQNYIYSTVSQMLRVVERKYLSDPELNYWASNKNISQVISPAYVNNTVRDFVFADKLSNDFYDEAHDWYSERLDNG